MKGKRHPTDEQLRALRAELEAVAERPLSPRDREAYASFACAPVGAGDGGMA